MIKNIIIEPLSSSQHFVVYAESHKKGDKKGVVVGINFSSLHEPQCRNPDSPNSESSDYETWTPGRSGHECVLGKKITYVRRKRESECFNGSNYGKKSTIEMCECSEEDYECDVGFARTYAGEPCTSLDTASILKNEFGDIYNPPANCDGHYTISKGYRKIPGNSCINGVKFDPIVIPCQSHFFSNIGKIFFIIIIFVFGFGLIYFGINKDFFSSLLSSGEKNKDDRERYINIIPDRDDRESDTLFEPEDHFDNSINAKIDKPSSKFKAAKESSQMKEMKDKKEDEENLHNDDDDEIQI